MKIGNIYCIEDCARVPEGYTYDAYNSHSNVNNDIVSFSLEKTLIMTNVYLRTLNLGTINPIIIITLGRYCYNLTHLSCELLPEDLSLFIKLLEVLKNLKHLKLMLELSSVINDNSIIALGKSISNSLQYLGLNIYDVKGNSKCVTRFLDLVLNNLHCNHLSKLEFYNDQMVWFILQVKDILQNNLQIESLEFKNFSNFNNPF